MKARAVLFLFIFVALIIVGMYFIISGEDDTIVSAINFSSRDVYVEISDKSTGERLGGNFSIFSGSNITRGFITDSDYLEQVTVPTSHLGKIYVQKQGYYSEVRSFNGRRAEVKLTKIGNLTFLQETLISERTGRVKLLLNTDSEVRKTIACVAWTQALVDVTNFYYDELNETDVVPSNINERMDKCYDIGKTVKKGDVFPVEFEYSFYDSLDDGDYIDLYIIDSDMGMDGEYFSIGANQTDVGARTFHYRIK